MKCPNCGSEVTKRTPDGRYKCSACLSTFSESEQKVQGNNMTKTVFDIIMKNKKHVESRFNTEMSGEELYEDSIAAVAEILCVDLNSAGSGFVVSCNGYVITNAHVILDDRGNVTNNVYCRINGEVIESVVIAYGNTNGLDIALLQLSQMSNNIKWVKLGNSDNVKIGSTVYAIGNSLGEGLCITKGIISDKDRMVMGCSCIMADVATNHGNSGGPLFDTSGEVIAICVAGIDGAAGMRYFIPINLAKKAFDKYI